MIKFNLKKQFEEITKDKNNRDLAYFSYMVECERLLLLEIILNDNEKLKNIFKELYKDNNNIILEDYYVYMNNCVKILKEYIGKVDVS
jgi:hypothetical protein